MPESLLKTKLFAPPTRRNLVKRPRLSNKLAEALSPEIRLTLVCAPPGFGKTTAVAEWLADPPVANQACAGKPEVKTAWLTLDEADNDPIRFWRYVDAALQTIEPRLGESIRPVLHAPRPPPFHTLMPELANDILNAGLEFILVLDDYHVIQNETVHKGVNFLIDHLPALAHPVIISRADPPLQLARRRAHGKLCELRASELRFTHDETALFINNIMRLGLSANDVAALEDRTEGWIAGLQMAAISLQDTTDPHAFVAAFRGDDRYIADYLLEEVLQRQPVEFQRFLLQTSVLQRLSGPLCDAVTRRSDSQTVLNALERANLFVIPLDNRREWFRYHHLFASLLQQRLLDTAGPSAVVDLKRRASQWHAANGNLVDSVEIAISCGDYEQAVTFIENSDSSLFMSDELNTLRRWAEQFPAAVIAAHPRLNLMAIWASHATGHVQQAERLAQLLEQAVGLTVDEFLEESARFTELTPLQRSALLECAVARARIATDTLDLEKTFWLGERTLPHLEDTPGESYAFNPPGNLRCVLLYELGLAHEFRGNLKEASRLFAEAEKEAVLKMNPHIIALAAGHLGQMQLLRGQAQEASATFCRAHETAAAFPPRSSAFWGLAHVGLGRLALQESDLEGAESHFQAGLELGKMWNVWECLLGSMSGLAQIRAARGDWDGAFGILDELLGRTVSNAVMVNPFVEALRAEFHLRKGDLTAAGHWASGIDTSAPGPYYLQWEQSALIAAQIWIAQGKRPEAEALLARLQVEAEAAGRQQIVQRIAQIISGSKRTLTPDMPDPLSERELEVLHLMAEGLSNPDIARKLYLSPNTLKAHAQNIYQKLNVHNRMEAVNRARELRLL